MTAPSPRPAAVAAFPETVARFDAGRPALVVSHFDADGLGAAAILARALARAGRPVEVRVAGKGESPWGGALRDEIAGQAPGGLIVADLGLRADEVAPGVPTVVIDHHVPRGEPPGTLVVSGHGLDPEPPTALLALWCAATLGDADDLLWLAALGIVGDMAEGAGFAEMAEAQGRYGKTALRDAASLVNAPRRTAAADAGPALALLMRCDSPKELLGDAHPEAALLRAAKAEVAAELASARRVPPRVRGDVALIRLDSAAQVHPLIAQQWRGRLADKVVIAANTGYRPGWVHFAARTATGRDLVAFLATLRPEGAGEEYGNGHAEASGGALRAPQWNAFVEGLGFPEARVPEEEEA